jgi:hypothetical protein
MGPLGSIAFRIGHACANDDIAALGFGHETQITSMVFCAVFGIDIIGD